MNVDKIINALNKMYAELYSNRKFCENCDACDLKGGEKFDFAVKVGENYGDKLKVLVIGKESKEKHTNVGTTESFEVQKNQHYRRTYDILNYLINDVPIDNYNGYKHISEKEISTLHAFFALTNHYHCYFGKKAHSRSSSNCMWYHCAGIVKQEIEILNPDVIIIQAGWAAKESTDLNDLEKILPIEKGNLHKAPETVGLYFYSNKGKKVYLIGSHHPSFNCWHKDNCLGKLKERLNVLKKHYLTVPSDLF